MQRSADRGERQKDRDEAARFQIAQQGFEGAQRLADRDEARLSREQQRDQFARAQDFTEEQARQDDLYRAIGTLLAAQEGGMDLGIGQREAAPGGLEALLRAQLGNQLDIDLTNFGTRQRVEPVDGAVTDTNPPRCMTLINAGQAVDGSGNTYTYNYDNGGWEYSLSNYYDTDNRTESSRRGES